MLLLIDHFILNSTIVEIYLTGCQLLSYTNHKSIYRGITTGLNDTFIIDNETKEELVAEDPKSAEIIKPVLRGRDIQRYRACWAGRWLIATFPSSQINIENYPAVEKKLKSYGQNRVEQLGKSLADGGMSRKKTPHKWFELQDTCAYHAEFAKEKIVWIQLVNNGRFSYDASGKLCEASTCILTGGGLKFLCAILNSKLVRWYFQQIAPTSGTGTRQWKKVYVEKIPIPNTDLVQQLPLIRLVDEILAAKTLNFTADTARYEIRLDQQIFELYHLTTQEIENIEKYVQKPQ